MEDNFDYQLVPYGYAHCFNDQCVKGTKCLRHLTAMHVTEQDAVLSIVNPKRVPEDTAACSFFQPIQKIRVAWGTKHLLDNVPNKDAASLKSLLIKHFGRAMYYRFYRKERYLTPEQQAYITNLFRQKGIMGEPVFELYTDEYNW